MSGRNMRRDLQRYMGFVPPALTRAWASQRDAPTLTRERAAIGLAGMSRCGVPARQGGTNVVNRPFLRRLTLRSASRTAQRACPLPVASVNPEEKLK